MSELIAPGTQLPEFSLRTADGSFTRDDLLREGKTSVLVFYPFAFSSVCTDQFSIYDDLRDEFAEQGLKLYGVSCDAPDSQAAFMDKLGVDSITQLSDFEPKGEFAKSLGVYFPPGGMATRALVIVDPDGVVKWSWAGEHPGVLPGANLIFDNV